MTIPYVFEAIRNGIPIPKYGHISWGEAIKNIKHSASTSVEADTESE